MASSPRHGTGSRGSPEPSPPTPAGLATKQPGQDLRLKAQGMDMLFAKRLAGAVYSLVYRGFEYVPPLQGNGGSLQASCGLDMAPGEAYVIENPNEAGALTDNGGKTTSVWTAAAASPTEVYTECRMAYWYPPGKLTTGGNVNTRSSALPARGAGPVSDTVLTKRVAAVAPGVLKYTLSFVLPGTHHAALFEALAAYLPGELSRIYVIKTSSNGGGSDSGGGSDGSGGAGSGSGGGSDGRGGAGSGSSSSPKPQLISGAKYQQKAGPQRVDDGVRAVVLASPDGGHALGVAALRWPLKHARDPDGHPSLMASAGGYSGVVAKGGGGGGGGGRGPTPLSKINLTWAVGKRDFRPSDPPLPAGSYTFEFVIAVGTLQEVDAALRGYASGVEVK